jgi:hypothetical protein
VWGEAAGSRRAPFPFLCLPPSSCSSRSVACQAVAAATRGSPEEKARGAAAGPFSGERVPREGERAAIEQFHDGALCPEAVHRSQLEVTFPRAGGGDGAGFLAARRQW